MATSLNSTTLSAALDIKSGVMTVASATNLSAPVANVMQQAYIIGPGQKRGELVSIIGVSSTAISIQRLDQFKAFWPSGSIVLIGPVPSAGTLAGGMFFAGGFQEYDPVGSNASPASNSANAILYTPWVNVNTGNQWIWSTVLSCWVPGFNNLEDAPAVTAAVTSAAPATLPSGPLFHVTGTAAIVTWTLPVGFTHGSFTVIPDGVFTWTAAGNIALAGTAVVNKALTFTWDGTNSKFIPSYIA